MLLNILAITIAYTVPLLLLIPSFASSIYWALRTAQLEGNDEVVEDVLDKVEKLHIARTRALVHKLVSWVTWNNLERLEHREASATQAKFADSLLLAVKAAVGD